MKAGNWLPRLSGKSQLRTPEHRAGSIIFILNPGRKSTCLQVGVVTIAGRYNYVNLLLVLVALPALHRQAR